MSTTSSDITSSAVPTSSVTSSSSFSGFDPSSDFPDDAMSSAIPTGRDGDGRSGDSDGGGGNPAPGASATLYLYTFLATLVLLLGVSSAIVVRSLMIRRRHRHLMEQAIQNGSWIPPMSGRGVRIDPANKPKMHEVYVGADVRTGEVGWGSVMPLYASQPPRPIPALPIGVPPPAAPPTNTSALSRFVPSRIRNRNISSSPNPSPNPPPTTTILAPPPPDQQPLQIAFIIAMPSPEPIRPPAQGEEAELPALQIGWADRKSVV